MADEIDIRFLINSPEVEAEASRTKAAISGVEKTTLSAGKAMSSAFVDGVSDVEDMTANIKIQKQVLADLEKQYKEVKKSVDAMAPGGAKVAAQQHLGTAKKEIDDERIALAELEAQQKKNEQANVALRTKIRNVKQEMAEMVEGTDVYIAKMHELGDLQDRMGDISAQGKVFADDEKHSRAATETVQGLAGAMSAATGIAVLFGASQENLAKIQARLQAVMAISIGVNQVAQVLNKDSYFSLIVLAKAKDIVTVATTRLSTALGISNAAAKALMATLTVGLSVAITGLVILINRWNKTKEEALAKDAVLHDQVIKCRIEIARETAEIERNFSALDKAQKGTKAYATAKENIISNYGKYLQGLSVEINTLQDVAGAYKAVKEAALESATARARAAFVSEAKTEANEKMGSAMKSIRDNLAKAFGKEYLDKFPAAIASTMAQITDVMMKPGATFKEQQKEVMGILEKQGLAWDKRAGVITNYNNALGGLFSPKNYLQDVYLEVQKLNGIEDVANRAFGSMTPPDDSTEQMTHLNDVLKNIVSTQKELATLNKKTSWTEAEKGRIADLGKNLKAYKDDYKLLTGKDYDKSTTPGKTKDYTPQLQKDGTERIREARDMEFAVRQAGIDAKAEGLEKTLAQNKLNYDREMEQLRRQQEDKLTQIQGWEKTIWESQNPDWEKKGLKFTPTTKALTDDQRTQYGQLEAGAGNELTNKNKEAYVAAMKDYADYASAYLAKVDEFNNNLKTLEKNGAAAATIEQVKLLQQEVLAGMDEEMEMKNEAFTAFVESMVSMGLEELLGALAAAKSALEAEVGNAQGNPAQVAQLQGKVKALTAQINKLTAVEDDTKEIAADPAKKWKDTLQVMTNVKALTNDIADCFGGLDDSTKAVLNAAMNIATGVINMIMSINMLAVGSAAATTMAAETATTTIKGVEKASVILAIISAAMQIAMAIASVITTSFSKDKQKEKEIQQLQTQVDALSESYDRLGKAIEKAYSSNASKLINDQSENLKQQNRILQQQIDKEKSKKKSDNNQIREWENQIKENNLLIQENKEKAVDAIFGSDVQSAIEDLANAYADAWAAGENRVLATKDVVKKMIKGVIVEMLKSDFTPTVEALRKKIQSSLIDGIISDAEQAEIDRLVEQATANADRKYASFDKYLTGDSNVSGASGQLKAELTEGTGSQLVGLWNMTAMDMRAVKELTSLQLDYSKKIQPDVHQIMQTAIRIEENTRATAASTAATVTRLDRAVTELERIAKNTKSNNSRG